jgi:hypothetical protein
MCFTSIWQEVPDAAAHAGLEAARSGCTFLVCPSEINKEGLTLESVFFERTADVGTWEGNGRSVSNATDMDHQLRRTAGM